MSFVVGSNNCSGEIDFIRNTAAMLRRAERVSMTVHLSIEILFFEHMLNIIFNKNWNNKAAEKNNAKKFQFTYSLILRIITFN